MKYYKRLKVYKCANLVFDPKTGEGSSYRWYSITRKFGKTQVLNTYGYSNTTSKHVWKIANVLQQLGISFVCIEAPRGLQDLERAMEHHEFERAEAAIKLKTARKPEKYVNLIQYHDAAIKFLKKLGIKSNTKAAHDRAKAAIELAKEHKKQESLRKAQLVSI